MTVSWFVYKRFPFETDLSDVGAFLAGQNIMHIVTREDEEQLLWIKQIQQVSMLDDFFTRYERGEIHQRQTEDMDLLRRPDFFEMLLMSPATALVVVFAFCGYLVGDVFKELALFRFFSFSPWRDLFVSFEFWRLVTPTFLHFTVIHFTLSGLCVFILGKKLETRLGIQHYLVLFLVAAVGGNILQFSMSSTVLFGGLSGVLYGYIGFLSASNFVYRDPLLVLPRIILVGAVCVMVLGFVNMLDWLTSGGFTDWAHLGGFAGGFLYAVYYYLFQPPLKGYNTDE